MKVIKNGMLYPKRTSCPKCHSLLEYTSEDKKIIYGDRAFVSSDPQRPGSNGIYTSKVKWIIECPICGNNIELANGFSTYTDYTYNRVNEIIELKNNYESPDHIEVENG